MYPPSEAKGNRHRTRNKRKEERMRRSNYIDDGTLIIGSAADELYGGVSIAAILSTPDGYIIRWNNGSVYATLHAVSIRYWPENNLAITAAFLCSDGFVVHAVLEAISIRYAPNGDITFVTSFTSPHRHIRSPVINVPHQQQTGSSEGESNEPIQHAHPYKSEIEKIEKLAQQAEALGDMVEKESAQLKDKTARLLKLFKPAGLGEKEE